MSSQTIGVDPGIRGCGVSWFVGSTLQHAGYVRNRIRHGNDIEAIRAMASAVWSALEFWGFNQFADFVGEIPRVYQGRKQKGDPNDLTPLAGVIGAIAMNDRFTTCTRYFPEQWKGTIDGDKFTARIRSRVSNIELARVESHNSELAHNTWDAVGLCLKHLGRLEPIKVFPR